MNYTRSEDEEVEDGEDYQEEDDVDNILLISQDRMLEGLKNYTNDSTMNYDFNNSFYTN